jgi:hypothetical protein
LGRQFCHCKCRLRCLHRLCDFPMHPRDIQGWHGSKIDLEIEDRYRLRGTQGVEADCKLPRGAGFRRAKVGIRRDASATSGPIRNYHRERIERLDRKRVRQAGARRYWNCGPHFRIEACALVRTTGKIETETGAGG